MAKAVAKSSALIDTRVIYCGDNLEELRKLPNACGDLIYIDPPFNSNRNYEVFWGDTGVRAKPRGNSDPPESLSSLAAYSAHHLLRE